MTAIKMTKTIKSLNAQNKKLRDCVNELSRKNINIEKKLHHIEEVLNTPDAIAECILESKINNDLFDTKKEYIYLIDVINFIHEACDDLSCGRLSVSVE